MNMPSHHQSAYFKSLSSQADLLVHYTGKQDARRQKLGWKLPELQSFEYYNTFFIRQLYTLFCLRKATHIITGCSSFSNILLWLFCMLFGINWFHLSENVPEPSQRSTIKNFIVTLYYRSVERNSLGAFAIGNKAKRSFEVMGVSSNKIFITNYSSAVNNKLTTKSSTSSPLRALVLGELSEHKGTDIIVEVIPQYSHELTVDFYGSVKPENAYFKTLIMPLSNAKFHGVIASDKVEALWAQYDLLIFPSRIDGWGMVVHEAIANNVPVICSKAAGASEHLIIDQHNGTIIDADSTSLSQAIAHYIRHPEQLIVQSQNCATHKLNYTPDATAKRFVNDIHLSLSAQTKVNS